MMKLRSLRSEQKGFSNNSIQLEWATDRKQFFRLTIQKNGFKAHIYKCGIMLRISLKAQ